MHIKVCPRMKIDRDQKARKDFSASMDGNICCWINQPHASKQISRSWRWQQHPYIYLEACPSRLVWQSRRRKSWKRKNHISILIELWMTACSAKYTVQMNSHKKVPFFKISMANFLARAKRLLWFFFLAAAAPSSPLFWLRQRWLPRVQYGMAGL